MYLSTVNQSIHPVCRTLFYLQRYTLGSVGKVNQEILFTFFQQVVSVTSAIFITHGICYLIGSLLPASDIHTYPITRISACQYKAFASFRKRYSTGVHSASRSVMNVRIWMNTARSSAKSEAGNLPSGDFQISVFGAFVN